MTSNRSFAVSKPAVMIGGTLLACLLGMTACGVSQESKITGSFSGAPLPSGSPALATPEHQTAPVLQVTAQQVCGLLPASLIQAMLNGKPPDGPGNPQTQNTGQATCTWSDSAGDNFSVTVSSPPEGTRSDCNSSPGKTISGPDWQGCIFNSGAGFGVDGSYYVEIPAANGLIESATNERAVVAAVFQGLS